MKNIFDKVINWFKHNYLFCIIVVLIVFICNFELPYVVYKPGGIVNLNDRINIENDNIKGSLSMSYVSLLKGTIPVLGMSYIFKNWDIVPSKDITIEGESVDELLELEKLYMASSIDNATIVAYKKAGKKIDIKKINNNVVYIDPNAKTDILVYDKIVSIDGKKIDNLEEIREIVGNYKENDEIKITVLRDGKEIDTTSKIMKKDGNLIIGISTLATYEYETEPEIKVTTKASESGSSGGLMLSLAIYNKLTQEDITKGKNIVGTGTIDVDGNVGEIDGVKYKILGAVKNKADIFLCPKENYKEAMEVKNKNKLDITIKEVATFDEAIDYLNSI